jgi:hypothetical protein
MEEEQVMSCSDIDTFIAWAVQEEACNGCDVVMRQQGNETVTEVTVRFRDMEEAGTIVQLVFSDSAQDSDCVIRILPGEPTPRLIGEPVDDQRV